MQGKVVHPKDSLLSMHIPISATGDGMVELARIISTLFSEGLGTKVERVDGTAAFGVPLATIDTEKAKPEHLRDSPRETIRGVVMNSSSLFPLEAA